MFPCYELITKFPTSDYICIAHPFHLLPHPHHDYDDDDDDDVDDHDVDDHDNDHEFMMIIIIKLYFYNQYHHQKHQYG